jgi:hypothetical protein
MSALGKFKELLGRGKDASASLVLEKLIRDRLTDYGRVSNFSLDSRRRRMEIEILLRGETDALTIIVEEYEVVSDSTGTHFIIQQATASREWIQRVLENFVLRKRFAVPEKYSRLVKLVVE